MTQESGSVVLRGGTVLTVDATHCVLLDTELLVTGDRAAFCAAVESRLAAYADAGVTWLTVEPVSRNFADFCTDVKVLASRLIRR